MGRFTVQQSVAWIGWFGFLCLGVTSCTWGTIDDSEFDQKYGDRRKESGGENMFYGEEAARLGAVAAERFGATGKANSVVITYNSVVLDAQDPEDPTRKAMFMIRSGEFLRIGSSSPEKDWDDYLPLSAIPWNRLREFAQKASSAVERKDVLVRTASINYDRLFLQNRKSGRKSSSDQALLDRLNQIPSGRTDNGLRLTFSFGESGLGINVIMDLEGNVLKTPSEQTSAGSGDEEKPDNLGSVCAEAGAKIFQAFPNSEVMAEEVSVYADHCSFEVISASDPSLTESLNYTKGRFSDTIHRLPAKSKEERFPLKSARLDQLPALIQKALSMVQPDFQFKYVIIQIETRFPSKKKADPTLPAVICRFYFEKSLKSHILVTDLDGKILKIDKELARP